MAFDPLTTVETALASIDAKTQNPQPVTVDGVAQDLTLKVIVAQMESLHEDLGDIKQLLFELLQIQDAILKGG